MPRRPPSRAQLRYLKNLGYRGKPPETVGQASAAIDAMLESHSRTKAEEAIDRERKLEEQEDAGRRPVSPRAAANVPTPAKVEEPPKPPKLCPTCRAPWPEGQLVCQTCGELECANLGCGLGCLGTLAAGVGLGCLAWTESWTWRLLWGFFVLSLAAIAGVMGVGTWWHAERIRREWDWKVKDGDGPG